MKEEFARVDVRETNRKESIIYYILKDNNYGIQISKKSENDESENDELVLHDIAEDRKEIENTIDQVIRHNNDITQVSYIIEDLLKNKDNSADKTLIS